PEDVDYVFMGQVLQAGAGQITARQAAVKAGIPMSVPATTINKVCLSGLNTIYLADLLIASGQGDIVVAGGMEAMTKAPHLLPEARSGYRLGAAKPVAALTDDGVGPATTADRLGGLRPAFEADGTIAAGNASQISDGGAAVVVMSKAAAERAGVTPLGEVVSYGQVAGPDASLLTQPSRAINLALEAAGKSIGDVNLFEINEAFAAVGLAS